ncbi:NADH-quinone oxidoreductase subunit A [Apibacter adventoris]|uniref:NADH-quinone oxidoreductase subunit A n=1 Tax=Apibacter adventoris TaxID=1679466 RepID=A0A2S8AGK5_9FLAO|nr:NADH-quinone oxidoreductase subunit A [Apibacter adventoris]PQL92470.1 NADH-quinone oxidoreductase subunit A [Apibacter adventoris]PQL95479.1 NADH-quinone oxidoreductase subunit A [Apibacter adventoris]
MSLPVDYVPVLIQVAVALGFSIIALIGSAMLGSRVHGKVKDDTFECGVAYEGDARSPFSIKYFLTAILFVLFDIEIVFFYPYALNIKEFGIEGFFEVVTFISIFLIGFIYVVKKGALDWEKANKI